MLMREMGGRLIVGVKRLGRGALRRCGFDVVRLKTIKNSAERRAKVLRYAGIDLVLDVGANRGQYALELRRHGYGGRMVSFEPLPEAFKTLALETTVDPLWRAVPMALGRTRGTALLNVAGNSESSSLLPMLSRHVASARDSAYVGQVTVTVETLEWALETFGVGAARPFLKLDVQGAEREILDGAWPAVDRLYGIQAEMSLVPLYAGGALLCEFVELLEERGFDLVGLEPGFTDADTGQLLQVDGIFVKRGLYGDEGGPGR